MKREFGRQMTDRFAIPQEAVSNAPITELKGKQEVCIENHHGILEYTDESVKVAVKRGAIRVVGMGLCIVRMTRRRVEIRGSIRALELE